MQWQTDSKVIVMSSCALVNDWFAATMLLVAGSLMSNRKVLYIYQIEAGFEICEIGGTPV